MGVIPTVQPLFPIGKTQWSKWDDDQRTAYNEARQAGVAYADAIQAANQTQASKPEKKHKNVLDVLEDVAEVATTVASVATSVAPVVGVASTLVKATKKKAK